MAQTSPVGVVDNEMNAAWRAFLRKTVNSFVKWDLVRFFHDNPHTVDTAENIAVSVGRDPQVLKPELDDLTSKGILERMSVTGATIYRLSSDETTRDLIHRFVAASHNREFRLKAIHQVIVAMRDYSLSTH